MRKSGQRLWSSIVLGGDVSQKIGKCWWHFESYSPTTCRMYGHHEIETISSKSIDWEHAWDSFQRPLDTAGPQGREETLRRSNFPSFFPPPFLRPWPYIIYCSNKQSEATANMVRKLTYRYNHELFPRSIPCKSHQTTDIARANKGNISYLAR